MGNFIITEKEVYIYSLLAYFPVMMFSNITGLKFNYVLALILVSFSVISAARRPKTSMLIYATLMFVVIKVFIVGVYALKPILIALLGGMVVYRFVELFNSSDDFLKERYCRFTLMLGGGVLSILVLQYLHVLPNKVGAMDFVNTTGVTIFGDYTDAERPSAYFYHPYDTALAILPMLVLLRYSNVSYVLAIIASLGIAYILGLKILMIFVMIFFLIRKKVMWSVSVKFLPAIFLALGAAVLALAMSNSSDDLVSFSAGRLVLWDLMLSQYGENLSVASALLGSGKDLLLGSVFWHQDESYTPHNQVLYCLFYLGGIGSVIFVISVYKLVDFAKCLYGILFAALPTLAFTGDLMVFLAFWIALSQAYIVMWKTTGLHLDG